MDRISSLNYVQHGSTVTVILADFEEKLNLLHIFFCFTCTSVALYILLDISNGIIVLPGQS